MKIFCLSPYYGNTFFSFFQTLLHRIWEGVILGQPLELVSDEIQLLVLCGVALSASVLGVFLVLRKMTMLANSLSHTILLGIVLAYLLGGTTHDGLPVMPLLFGSALVVAWLTVFLTDWMTRWGRVQIDASIGLVFTTLFALGVTLVTLLTRNLHLGIEAITGNPDLVSIEEVFWVFCIATINLIFILLFFKELKATTFDPRFALTIGLSPIRMGYFLLFLVAITTMAGFRAVGVIVVLSLFTAPPITARLLTNSLSRLILLSALFGVGSAVFSVALTRHVLSVYGLALSTVGMLSLLLLLCVVGAMLWTSLGHIRLKKKLLSEI